MPVGRQPVRNKQDNSPTMLRSVRIDDDVFAPGEEDDMKEALEAHVDAHNKKAKSANKAGGQVEEMSYDEELHRLELGGFVANFVELDEEEIEQLDPDLRANAQHRAHVEEIRQAEKEGVQRAARGSARSATAKARAKSRQARKGPTQKADETVEDDSGE